MCGRRVLRERADLERRLVAFVERGPEPSLFPTAGAGSPGPIDPT